MHRLVSPGQLDIPRRSHRPRAQSYRNPSSYAMDRDVDHVRRPHTQALRHLGDIPHLTLRHLLVPRRQNLQQCQRLLGLLVRGHVLDHSLGFRGPGNAEGFAPARQAPEGLAGLEVADRLDLGGIAHGDPDCVGRVRPNRVR